MSTAGEAAGVTSQVGAVVARDLREGAGGEVPRDVRGGAWKAAGCHTSEVQPEGLQKVHTSAGLWLRGLILWTQTSRDGLGSAGAAVDLCFLFVFFC